MSFAEDLEHARNRQEAFAFVRSTVNVSKALPNGWRTNEITQYALIELIHRHEKLCEAVLGILTENPPEVIGMSNAGYRQHLRDMVLVALNGEGASVQ